MSVSSHLGIRLAEYDRRIRTFIPHYEDMLDAAAGSLAIVRPGATLVELGVGTGALSKRCLQTLHVPAGYLGIDADPDILEVARRRLRRHLPPRARFASGDFATAPLPPCDAIVASFALHHVRTAAAKTRVYAHCRAGLRPAGVLVNADVHLPSDPRLRALGHEAWRAHLRASYGAREADGFLKAWSAEDVYFSLDRERAMLEQAGFDVDVVWRRDVFAVVLARVATVRTAR